MGKKAKSETVSAKPLFEWFKQDRGNRAKLRAAGFSHGRITNYKSRGIPRGVVAKVAAVMNITHDQYVAAAAGEDLSTADRAVARNGKEEILLELYRGLFPLQYPDFFGRLRAMFAANNVTRRHMGNKPLVGVSDEQVVRAFGKAPFKRMKKTQRKVERNMGDAMGDFLVEE